jgi:transposase-like protein
LGNRGDRRETFRAPGLSLGLGGLSDERCFRRPSQRSSAAGMGKPYPTIKTLWEGAWSEFIPFLDYDVEIRKVICSTNVIESLNARYRRAVRARGHCPVIHHPRP